MNWIIVPVVAGSAMTRECIESLLAQDIGDVQVLAINNGSRDCGPVLRQFGKRITLVEYSNMRSLNKIWNDAIDITFGALQQDHVLVVNNDTVLAPHTYRLLRDDGGPFVTGIGVSMREAMEWTEPEQRSPHPDFSCFLIRKECWQRVGKFEETYWAYASDCSYHVRMHRAGVDAACINVPFYHIASGTIKQSDEQTRRMIQVRSDADRETFKQQYGFAVGSPEYNAEFLKERT